MKIALLTPRYWPEVNRGTERVVHDTAVELAQRGHDVTLLVTHPGPRSEAFEDGCRVVRMTRLPSPLRLGLYERYLTSTPGFVWELFRGGFDVAHAFFPSLAWAAVRARTVGGPPVVFSQHGIATREYLVGARFRLEMLQRVLSEAAAVTVLSQAAAEAYRRYLLFEPEVVPGGVDLEAFAIKSSRAPGPTLICAAALNDPRKRGGLLFEAFERLRRSRPEARLVLAGGENADAEFGGAELSPVPNGAERVSADRTDVLADLYANAWASVLPSIGEAFGLVLIESLASGTPVVAARSGACPEIITDDRIGRLFEPDDAGDLARAMDEALELADLPRTPVLARERAKGFDKGRVAEQIEQLYRDAIEVG